VKIFFTEQFSKEVNLVHEKADNTFFPLINHRSSLYSASHQSASMCTSMYGLQSFSHL
jgi:hypothetical protein